METKNTSNPAKPKLKYFERLKAKLLLNKARKTIGKTKEEIKDGLYTEKEKQNIIKALLELNDIFEITTEDNVPINEYILQTTPLEELIDLFEEMIKQLEEIV